jgi:hypothetical protein
MKCKLCQRQVEGKSEFCIHHRAAEEMLMNAYSIWRNAYGELSWSEYLDKVKQLKGTGQWVNEIIESEKEKSFDQKKIRV